MNIWDADADFVPLSDDRSLDTAGTQADGSWFDSFSAKRNPYWSPTGPFKMKDGKMVMTASDPNRQIFVTRGITPAENFEVECRLKYDYWGADTGFTVGLGDRRIAVYLYESKIRMNIDRAGSPRAELAYVDIGSDWHTYRLVYHDGIARLYVDGRYLLAAEPEKTASNTVGLTFFSIPANAYHAAVTQIEYAAYRVLTNRELSVTEPAAREILEQGKAVTVTAALSDGMKQSGKPVKFWLNGVFAGETDADHPTVRFDSLNPGVYSVWVSCGDVTSCERIFSVTSATSASGRQVTYSVAECLQSGYLLRFTVSGDGCLTAGDGRFPLSLIFSEGRLRYGTDDGEKNVSAGTGDYIAAVDGGVLWLWRNGKMLLSCRLPAGACRTVAEATGAISSLSADAGNGTFWQKDITGAADMNLDPGDIGTEYAFEFAYAAGEALTLTLADGSHLLDLRIAADGTLSVLEAPQLHAERKERAKLTGSAVYRVAVSNGIAILFSNNRRLASFRMPESVATRNLSVRGNGLTHIQIRETGERFFWSGKPTESDWNSWFATDAGMPAGTGTGKLLKLYSRDTVAEATVDIGANATGLFCLAVRYFPSDGSGVIAGYDFDSGCFRFGERLTALNRVDGGKRLPLGRVTLTLRADGKNAVLLCNGEKICGFETSLNGWGNAGFLDGSAGITLTSFTYEGDGNALAEADTTILPNDHTVGLFELNGRIYETGERGTYVSDDRGRTFAATTDFQHRGYNMIVLQSGKLLSLVRIRDEAGLIYKAWLSADDGKTWNGPYNVQSDYNDYRFTMNGKVIQTGTGRIFFVSGETEDENIGTNWIYYSDNDGVTWKKSKTVFSQKTTGMNIQEGCIVELNDGILRFYARNDSGFLVYSDSQDGGKTWDTELKMSAFASVVSAFNVRKDPVTGAIYMAWEYNNLNDCAVIQVPRTRMGLAISYDNAKTWEYVGDIDELNRNNFNTFAHWNLGMWITEDAVFVTGGKKIDNVWYNYTVRLEKSRIVPMARFNSLRTLREYGNDTRDGARLSVMGTLALSAATGQVWASGRTFEVPDITDKRTMLDAEIIASFLGGSLAVDGKTATVKVGNAEYVFTAGSDVARIAGEEKEMTFAAGGSDGSVKVSVEDLHRLLGLRGQVTEEGVMVLTVSATPRNFANLATCAGIS